MAALSNMQPAYTGITCNRYNRKALCAHTMFHMQAGDTGAKFSSIILKLPISVLRV